MTRRWGHIEATKNGETVSIMLYHGQNSFGESDVFAGACPVPERKEFDALRGWPLYAIQQWLVSNGYTYEVK